jgi:ABC-type transporter Mla subunit MlaD
MEYLHFIPYTFIAGWAVFAIMYISRAKNNYSSVNPIIFDHIPAVFTTLGVFGTFLGIAFGLIDFNVDNIDDSIPTLLEGLFVAFWSSIIGIALSLVSQIYVQRIQNSVLSEEGELVTEEQILRSIATSLEEIRKAISSDADGSISTHLVKMRTSINDNLTPLNANIQKLTQSVGGEGDTSLLTQIQNLRLESKEGQGSIVSNQQEQLAFMKTNTELVEKKFDEFTELLKQSNTEALVEVIEKVIGGFNERLNELIERLVKENFEELNKSVENLNKWQQANKEQVEALLNQYKTLTEQLTLSATTIENVSKSTETLVGEDGKLVKLIDELNTITKDGDNVLVKSIENLEGTTKDYKEVSEEIKTWFQQHTEFSDKIENLVNKLDEIEQLRNSAEGFFDDVRKEFEEAATILKQSNSNVKEQVDDMKEAFTDGMDKSFTALDSILRNMVLEYAERMNKLNNN